MFGKSEWFTKGRRAGRVRPAGPRGWAYLLTWASAIAAPAAMLMSRHLAPEAGIWLAAMGLLWWLDFRSIRAGVWRGRPADLFVIDENTDITQLTTRNYDMSLRS